MPEWVNMPTFSNGKAVRASHMGMFIDNINYLKYKPSQDTYDFNLTNEGTVTVSATASFVSIDDDKYKIEAECRGGVVLVGAAIYAATSGTGSPLALFGLFVDNILYGYADENSANDVTREVEVSYYEMDGLIWAVEGLAAGVHTFEIKGKKIGTDDIRIDNARRNHMWFVEIGD